MPAYECSKSAKRRGLTSAATILLVALLGAPAPARSDVASAWGLPRTFQIHGFASQSFILTTDNNFFGRSTSDSAGSWDFREIGINGSWRALPRLQLSMQVTSRKAGESDDGDPRIDYGYADYSFLSDADNLWGVQAGRVVNPFGLYSETRDVAATRPSILLPQSIYFDRVRDVGISSDGFYLYGERRTSFGDFFLKAGAVWPRVKGDETELSLLGGDLPGDMESSLSYIGRLMWEYRAGRIRAAVTHMKIDVDYDPKFDPPNDLPDGTVTFKPWIFSLQYNSPRWTLTSEYAIRRFELNDFGPLDTNVTGESFYLQAAWRFVERWEAMARYDLLFTDRDDRDGSEFEKETGLPDYTRFAKDFTVGLRWDITNAWMVRAEYHNVNGTAWITRTDNPDPFDTEQHWQMFALLTSYRF